MRMKKGEGEEGKICVCTIARILCPHSTCGMSSLGQLMLDSRLVNKMEAQCPDKCFGYSVVLPRTDCWEGIAVCYLPGGVAKTIVEGFAS